VKIFLFPMFAGCKSIEIAFASSVSATVYHCDAAA
jgi:hypothetical protein